MSGLDVIFWGLEMHVKGYHVSASGSNTLLLDASNNAHSISVFQTLR